MDIAVARRVERHALFWLLAGNIVGVWLAAVLLWPALGDLVAPLTYGRWVPLHLNWQLYGWCALPQVGALLAWFLPTGDPGAVRVVLGAWSLALVAGGLAWLGGVSSGKLFLDWYGWARPFLPLAMTGLWLVLARAAWRDYRVSPRGTRWVRTLLLVALAAVPVALYAASDRQIYPAVNPDSGGATGASLLASTLAVIAIFGLLPCFLRVPGTNQGGWKAKGFWLAWAVSVAAWSVVSHGNASHHATGQILGLAVLIAWVPLLALYARGFAWRAAARPWLNAAFGWWLLLVVTGFCSFLPGISERLKFTHALVAHAHLAMAGLLTAVNFMVLRQLREASPAANRGFGLWQVTTAVQVAVLLALGWVEAENPAEVFSSAGWVQAVFAWLAAGVVMAAVSLRWWVASGLQP